MSLWYLVPFYTQNRRVAKRRGKEFMKTNKIGLVFLIFHTVIIISLAAMDKMFTDYHSELAHAGTTFLIVTIIIDFLPFLLFMPIGKAIPVIGLTYFKYGWSPVAYFVILGGLQWYLIGWGISALASRFKTKRRGRF